MKGLGALLRAVYTRRRSRIGGFPSVLMSEPAGVMAKEITTPAGQVGRCWSAPETRCCRCPTATNWKRRSRPPADGRHRPLRQRDARAL